MSDTPPEDANLLIAIRLVRLKDRLHASSSQTLRSTVERLDNNEEGWRKTMEGLSGLMKTDPREFKRLTKWMGVEVPEWMESILNAWSSAFARDADSAERFLGLLEGLKLDVSKERSALKELRQKAEETTQRLAEFIRRLGLLGKTGKVERFDDIKPVFKDILWVSENMDRLRERINTRSDDAIRLVVQAISNRESQRLLELFTGEP
jgi:hypothetical protein